MKKVQNEIYESIGKQEGVLAHGSADMIAQIHDEIIFEIDDDPEIVVARENKLNKLWSNLQYQDFQFRLRQKEV